MPKLKYINNDTKKIIKSYNAENSFALISNIMQLKNQKE